MIGKIHHFAIYWCFIFICIISLISLGAFASEVVESTVPPETSESLEIIETTEYHEEIETIRSVSPVSPSDASGFKAVLLSLFGNYDTVVTEYRYTNSNGYTSVTIDVQEDWPWIISACIFSIVLYCLFRMLGGVLFGRK